MGQAPEQEIMVCDLIEIQRMLANAEHPFERLVGTLFVAGMLDMRLAKLTDRQIGQLMFDAVADQLSILRPETMIWRSSHAATVPLGRRKG